MTDVCLSADRPALVSYGVTSSLKFGTSGFRCLVQDLPGTLSRAYVLAFIRRMMAAKGCTSEILVGRDLRSSSPAVALDSAAPVDFSGLTAIDCCKLPTPTLALEGQRRNYPPTTGTGSHIPDDRNGLKFYTPDDEITKEDVATVVQEHRRLSSDGLAFLSAAPPRFIAPEDYPLGFYTQRYVRFIGLRALKGLYVVVRRYNSVARNVLADIGLVTNVNQLDGLRFQRHDGSTVRYRAFGDAPALRCYVEAEGKERGENLVAWGHHAATNVLQQMQHGPI